MHVESVSSMFATSAPDMLSACYIPLEHYISYTWRNETLGNKLAPKDIAIDSGPRKLCMQEPAT
jgi:hypothetical protein